MEKAPVGRPKSSASGARKKGHRIESAGVRGERAWQKVATRVAPSIGVNTTGIRGARVHNLDWPDPVRHIRGPAAGQGDIIISLVHLNGKPGGEACDALHLPALGQSFWRSLEGSIERNGPNVAGHEIVPDVSR